MQPGRDYVWVFSGKVFSHEKLLREQFAKLSWEFKPFTVIYDPQSMKLANYFKRQRGVANASATELVFLCWKGTFPKEFAKHRLYVDKGSATYVNFISKVPVACPSELALVSRQVKD
jgi:hypothetical protein